MSIIKQNIKVSNILLCDGSIITEKDGKLQYKCSDIHSNVSMSGCVFIKHSPGSENRILNITKNTNNSVHSVNDSVISHHTNDIELQENGFLLKNGEYTINASLTFKSTVNTNILVTILDSEDTKLSSIGGTFSYAGEICNIVVFGVTRGYNKLIKLIIRSELDTNIEIIDWSILFNKI